VVGRFFELKVVEDVVRLQRAGADLDREAGQVARVLFEEIEREKRLRVADVRADRQSAF
jgi:hypothetical protein